MIIKGLRLRCGEYGRGIFFFFLSQNNSSLSPQIRLSVLGQTSLNSSDWKRELTSSRLQINMEGVPSESGK